MVRTSSHTTTTIRTLVFGSERGTMQNPLDEPKTGLDYVALVATVVLGVIACVALYMGNQEVALVVSGAVAGYVTRLYH